MKTIITFLGFTPPIRNLEETQYEYRGEIYEGEVFAVALDQFCDYDKMLVCVTPGAKASTWLKLKELGKLNNNRVELVEIPTGKNNAEMWEIFETITARINPHESVIFDITHGLRMLPFLVFLFAAYLKSAKQVEISAVYYGALELRDRSKNEPAPVIDLSEFVSMFDWITATTRFTETGDGQALAALLYAASPSKDELKYKPDVRPYQTIAKAAKSIESTSLALSLARPIEVMKSASQLEDFLVKAKDGIAQRAKPFSLLSEQVLEQYGQFALALPEELDNVRESLSQQFHMIGWYLKRDRIIQATTLMREWIVSVLMWKFGLGEMMMGKKVRGQVENALGNAAEDQKPEKRRHKERLESLYEENMQALDNVQNIGELWGQLGDIRNDLAHVGMKSSRSPASTLKENANKIFGELEACILPLIEPLSSEDAGDTIAL
jgi:CRISPR-associated DxTHG motif protein